MKKLISSLAVMVVVCICMVMVGVGIPVSALSYSGSGTMADPYLVTNAEQLQGMRENLSAHYKLANTIDLSGVDFKAIGHMDNRFTGSFICELNSDNTPKYVIKNLKIHVAETAYAGEGLSKWEAALFGATDGATISGIYLLDVNITNDVLGDNKGALAYGNYKPGMDDMASAALIGFAYDTTITNCASTGKTGGRASGSAGLIGRAFGCTVENCYSTATVTTEGKWHIGGLIGYANSTTTVSSCFAAGNVTGGQTNIAGFIPGGCGTVSNCYSIGDVDGGYQEKASFTGSAVNVTNCFALGTVKGETQKTTVGGTNVTNVWSLSGKISNMTNFKQGSLAEIKAAFANLPGWDVSGEYPTLTSIGVVTDASKYVPETVSSNNSGTSTSGSTSTSGGTSTSTSGGTSTNGDTSTSGSTSETVEASTADEVVKLAEALPEDAETLTLDNKQAVMDAWFAYGSLSVGEKDDFDANLFARINNSRKKMSMLMAGEVIDGVTALPDVEDLSSSDVENILSLYKDYNFLEDEVKSLLDKELVEKLNAAYEWSQSDDANVATMTVSSELQPIEWVIVIFCGVIILIACSFAVVSSILMIKSKKKSKI